MKMTKLIWQRGCLGFWLLFLPLFLGAQAPQVLPTDLYVDLLVVEPGNTLYTSYGHCALRLQCPSKHMDVSFTFGLDDTFRDVVQFFTGNGRGTYSRLVTETYLHDYQRQGRGVKAYAVNLTLDEKRNLWQLLDVQTSSGSPWRYNYMHTNCASMCVYAINQALLNEQVDYGRAASLGRGTYRDYIRAISAGHPWTNFVWQSLIGAEGEEKGNLEDKLSPERLAYAYSCATFVGDNGSRRPVLVGRGRTVIAQTAVYPAGVFTPVVCFGLLFLFSLAVTVMERRSGRGKVARTFDLLLFALQTVMGCAIFFMTFFSRIETAHLNLYVIPFNPLPLLLWLVFRRRRGYARVYAFYTVVLLLFLLAAPFMPQADAPHLLLLGTLALRTFAASSFLRTSRELKEAVVMSKDKKPKR
jgi:hypothetical protein